MTIAPFRAKRCSAALLTVWFLAGAATAQIAPRAVEPVTHFRVVHSFSPGADRHAGGATPRPLMRANDGNFYGVCYAGGEHDFGTVFRMKPGGSVTTLHSFNISDGFGPQGALIQASDGNLYGVTHTGGTGGSYPVGTVFRIDTFGVLTSLHTFLGPDGGRPDAGLVQASDGYLYGTTSDDGQFGNGTVYRIALDGTFQVMYQFGANANDGRWPHAALIQVHDGRLCGTTYGGGRWGGGVIYCMSLDGQMSNMHAFGAADNDASGSTNPLVEGEDGSLYGTSNFGGSQGQGAVFRLKPDGHIKVMDLWARPSGGLLKASDGNFYGTAFWGGDPDLGWVYRVTPHGKLTELHAFSGADGANPDGELIEADGRLYGVTEGGGDFDAGVVFGITGALAPPVRSSASR